MMLEGAGFEVIDLGVDVSPEKFVEAAREKGADIIGLSALLTTTMPGMKDVIEAIKSSDLKGKLKVMIGGAPVTQDYADEIGADGYAPDAASAPFTPFFVSRGLIISIPAFIALAAIRTSGT